MEWNLYEQQSGADERHESVRLLAMARLGARNVLGQGEIRQWPFFLKRP
jgi:hypothetical protein